MYNNREVTRIEKVFLEAERMERVSVSNYQQVHLFTRKGAYIATLIPGGDGLIILNKDTGYRTSIEGLGKTTLGVKTFHEGFFGHHSRIISGEHVEIAVMRITFDGCEIALTDLNSTNGTVYTQETFHKPAEEYEKKTDPITRNAKHFQRESMNQIETGQILGGGQEGKIISPSGSACAITLTGGRKNNEDGIFVSDGQIAVADGMGGEECGELASELALFAVKKNLPDENISLRQVLEKATHQLAKGNIPPQSGTTLAMARKSNPTPSVTHFELAHVGDAKIYVVSLNEKIIIYESPDQSRVQELIRRKMLKPVDRYRSERNNLITNCIRAGSMEQSPVITNIQNTSNQTLVVLCSDGISDFVTPEEILLMALENPDPEKCSEEIKNTALMRHNQVDGFHILLDGKIEHVKVNNTDNLSVAVMRG
jgi:PPM family protein phosphatase